MREETDSEIEMQHGGFDDNTSNNIVLISSHDELVTFLMEILDLNDDVESEEKLLENTSYRILYSLLERIAVFTVAIENTYVDRVYRDSYYMHYSCKHIQYYRFCKRLFLFEGNLLEGRNAEDFSFPDLDVDKLQKIFIGTVVIRPLQEGKIGRTLINPYFVIDRKSTYLRYAKYTATIFGMRLQINAFPFSMQDGETTTCAEITILNLLDYFSEKYPEYKYVLPSEISHIAVKNGYERNLPTKGLGYSVITKVFSEVGFSPRLYNKESFTEMSQFKRVMHYYIESGLPVALGVKIDDKIRHSIICIGHGTIQYDKIGKKIYAVYDGIIDDYIWLIDSADLCDAYIVMDDGQVPYERYQWQTYEQEKRLPDKHMFGKYEPDVLMVPLYKRMFLEAQDAYSICTSVLASKKMGIQRFYPKLGTKETPVIVRLFMAASRSFKQRRIAGFGKENEEIRERYVNIRLPRFVWVCEIYDREGYCGNKVLGEIVVDATASPFDDLNSILLLHYPFYIMVCNQQGTHMGEEESMFDKVSSWERFDGYDHNLFSPEKIR